MYRTSEWKKAAGYKVSPEKKEDVEKAAMRIVKEYLEKQGYRLELHRSVYDPYDYVGYDPSGRFVWIEVKGHEPPILSAELSSDEASFAEKHPNQYIICVVAKALSENPDIICRPYDEWKKNIKEEIRRKIIISP